MLGQDSNPEQAWMDDWNTPNLPAYYRRDLLEILYKMQIKRFEEMSTNLYNLDFGKIYRLGKTKNKVVEKAMAIYRPDCFPFVPVLPKGSLFTFYDIIKAIPSNEGPWVPSLSLKQVTDVEHHRIPYVIFNIRYGKDTRSLSPREGLKRIEVQKLHPINLSQGLAIRTHIQLFRDREQPFHCCGSTYGEGKKFVPGLHHARDQSNLTFTEQDQIREKWVCPSYEESMTTSWHGLLSPKAYADVFRRSQS